MYSLLKLTYSSGSGGGFVLRGKDEWSLTKTGLSWGGCPAVMGLLAAVLIGLQQAAGSLTICSNSVTFTIARSK